MAKSPEQIEAALERAGHRLAAALDRISDAADRRVAVAGDGTGGDTNVEDLEDKLRELEAENTQLRETGKAVADGIEQTIETLRRARA